MTPLEIAVNAAARAYCAEAGGGCPKFEELNPLQKFGVLEYVTALVAPAIKAYEEAKASGTDTTQG